MIVFVSTQYFHTVISKEKGKKVTSQVNLSNYAKFICLLTLTGFSLIMVSVFC